MIEKSDCGRGTEAFSAGIPATPQEAFVNGVYASMDKTIACELERLRREEGIVPLCKPGCCHCCRYHILITSAEAHTLAQYLRREFSADQINGLQARTQQWHEWDNSRPGRYPSAGIETHTDFSGYEHYCPLLVNGICSAYPVRPVVCRAHFVSSHPMACCAANDPESREAAPVVLKSIVTATNPLSMEIRDRIEKAGLDFSRSQMLLPHWLAIEMGWAFAISV